MKTHRSLPLFALILACCSPTWSNAQTGQGPYGGTAWAIPGTVQFEDYDTGGEGVAFHELTSGNDGGAYRSDSVDIYGDSEYGYMVGYNNGGEWLEYTVDVATTGDYDINVRAALLGSDTPIQISADGVTLGTLTITSTGDWGAYQTFTLSGVSLSAGQRVLRFTTPNGGINIDWFQFGLNGSNQAPSVNAGSDAAITLPTDSVNLDGTVSDDGLPTGGTLTTAWSKQSGPGSVVFGNSNAVDTSATFSAAGTYVLRLTADDSALQTFDEVTITVQNQANQAPNGTIGSPAGNLTINLGEPVSFAGSGSDPDSNTPLTYLWNFGAGSGLADSTAQNPGSKTFSNAGTFPVTFTVTDSLGLADPSPATRTITVQGAAPTNVFPSSGNVGIGAAAPSSKLYLYNPGTGGTGDVAKGEHFAIAAYAPNIQLVDLSASADSYFIHLNEGLFKIGRNAGSAIDSDLVLLNGKVGIGTSAPGSTLDVAGGFHADYGLFGRDDAATGTPWQIQLRGKTDSNLQLLMGMNTDLKYGSIQAYWQSHGPRNLALQPAGGNLGIGTISPAAKLEVEKPWGSGGPNDVAAFFGGRSANDGRYNTYIIGHTIGVGYGNDTDDSMLWINFRGYQAGNTRYRDLIVGNGKETAVLKVDGSSGNVGIGTLDPTEKLSVNGTIRAKEVLVEASPWPDDVFAPDYKLASVEEVSAHIETEGHLPGVPSAAAVAENGVALGQMQQVLLRKVEELTLYVIQQDQRIKELEARLQEQDQDQHSSKQ